MPISLSVIIPALNEVRNIEAAITGVLGSLETAGIQEAELLVMTCLDRDGKNDGTVDIVRRLAANEPQIRSIHCEGYQKLGEKYRNAALSASKEYVIMIPGDNENDPAAFPKIFSSIGQADMVVSYTSNPEVRPWHRRWLSKTYTAALNFLFRQNMPYYNGINVYRTEDIRQALPTTDSFAYAAEILLTLLKKNKTYVTMPIVIQMRQHGKSKALSWRSFKSVTAAILRLWARVMIKK